MTEVENKKMNSSVTSEESAVKSTQSIKRVAPAGGKKQIWEKKTASDKEAANKRAPRSPKVKNRTRFGDSNNEFSEKVINISRVTKVVKGGRRFSFSAFVVVGDKKGRVGFGHGKANEVPDSIKKAVKDARNHLITVPIFNKITVPHEIHSKFLASRVMLKPAPKGKGIVASNTVRAVVELAGYTDIYSKTYGSRSKANIVRATLKALQQLRTPEQIAEIRDKDVKSLL
ncbi:30S ribosomal protein S5 [Mycoplasma sp. U97]|uniref:30S ribosomal protein S5 n=1 Tax=Mycoplasma tauri TaxID=547987 RepID=UPI001CC092B6|nr:30S ribosomal protein S5 [Mycoplasma tauri]MBZ4212590.1 30S ribosomal protein S5 [Mycoplasma tauri]